MRKSIVLFFVLFGLSLSAQNTKVEILKEFLSGVVILDVKKVDLGQPIVSIKELAQVKADKTMDLTKENIVEALNIAKTYKTCIVTVGEHTLIKITDFKDCSPSGAWGVCMPKGKGYVQKNGVLNEVDDYIKNIIGRPDSIERKIFLFN